MKDLYGNIQHYKFILASLYCLLISAAGCNGPVMSSTEQLAAFNTAGEVVVPLKTGKLDTKKIYAGIYRAVPGDVIEFQMPTILSAKSADLSDLTRRVEPFLSRINESGTVTLPIVGEMYVAGMTMTEIESSVLDAYYPKYVVNRPAVVCKVSEHITKKIFTVMGLVNKPGVFPYPPEVRYNLMEVIASAGGLHIVADPQYATIYRRNAYGEIVSATLKINSKSMVQASTVMIKPGDIVAVEMTARERANMILSQMFYIRAGADFDVVD